MFTIDEIERAETVEAFLKAGGLQTNIPQEEQTFYSEYLIKKWEVAQNVLSVAKADEMELRKKVVDFISNPNIDKGTERVELADGRTAKTVKKITYGFVQTTEGRVDKKAIDAALTKIETMGPAEALMAERLIKWTPDLSMTEYKEIPANIKAIIDEVIRTKEGAPTLEIIEPKAKK